MDGIHPQRRRGTNSLVFGFYPGKTVAARASAPIPSSISTENQSRPGGPVLPTMKFSQKTDFRHPL